MWVNGILSPNSEDRMLFICRDMLDFSPNVIPLTVLKKIINTGGGFVWKLRERYHAVFLTVFNNS